MLAELRIAQERDKEYMLKKYIESQEVVEQITNEKEELEAYSRCIEELHKFKVETLEKRLQSVMKENKNLRDEVYQLSFKKRLNEEEALQNMQQLQKEMEIKDERIKDLERMVDAKNVRIDSLLSHDINEHNCGEISCTPKHGHMGHHRKSLDFKGLNQEIMRLRHLLSMNQIQICQLQNDNRILRGNMEKDESGKSLRMNWPQTPSISHNQPRMSIMSNSSMNSSINDFSGYSSYELSPRIFDAIDELEAPLSPLILYEGESHNMHNSRFEYPMSSSPNRQKSRDMLLSINRKTKKIKKRSKGKLNRTKSGIGRKVFKERLQTWHQQEASL